MTTDAHLKWSLFNLKSQFYSPVKLSREKNDDRDKKTLKQTNEKLSRKRSDFFLNVTLT